MVLLAGTRPCNGLPDLDGLEAADAEKAPPRLASSLLAACAAPEHSPALAGDRCGGTGPACDDATALESGGLLIFEPPALPFGARGLLDLDWRLDGVFFCSGGLLDLDGRLKEAQLLSTFE